MAATILSSAPGQADPLAMTDTGFPFGSIFQQVVRDPAPQAAPEESVTEEQSGVTDPRFQRQVVGYNGPETAGTIVIDTPHTYLYYVLGQGRAIRYGIGVGRDGFRWSGVQTVANKQEWPDWHPPAEMIARQPYLPRMMAGGPGNPLGARAMYLGSSEYRIHGTNDPTTIGKRVSSGCIRLTNADVEDLYNRVTIGTKVVVLPDSGYRAEASAPRPVKYSVPVRQQHAAPVVHSSYAVPAGRTYSVSSPSASPAPVPQRVSFNDETPRPPMSIHPY
jgi:lipoprotein-anchoring transpeptidase ErfK/SrfK